LLDRFYKVAISKLVKSTTALTKLNFRVNNLYAKDVTICRLRENRCKGTTSLFKQQWEMQTGVFDIPALHYETAQIFIFSILAMQLLVEVLVLLLLY